MKPNLFNITAILIVAAALVLFSEIHKGTHDAILHDIESRKILFIEVWYHPNGEIAGIKF